MSWPLDCRIWEWNVRWEQIEGLGTGWEVPQLRGGGGQACGNSFVTGVGFWDLGHLMCVRFHICKASLTVSSRARPSCWLLSESTGQCRNGSVCPGSRYTFCRRFLSSVDQSHLSGLWPGVAGEGAGQESEPGNLCSASI